MTLTCECGNVLVPAREVYPTGVQATDDLICPKCDASDAEWWDKHALQPADEDLYPRVV